MAGGRSRGGEAGERWVRLLLLAFPVRFRGEHGRDLIELHRDLRRNGRWPVRWLEWPLTVWDIVSSGVSLRFEDRRERRRQGGRGGIFMGNIATDVRQVGRGLRKAPGFTVVALITVALGIGANAAIFSVVNGVLLKPLPYDRPDQLVSVSSRFLPVSGFDFPRFSLDPTEYLDYRDHNRTFESFAAWYATGVTHTAEGADAERIQALVATWNLLPLLHVTPLLGRLFGEEDDLPGDADRLILTHAFWVRAYGSDPGIVGRSITLNGRPFEVVGVLPEGFSYPSPRIDVFTTLNLAEHPSGRQSHYLSGVARLADGVTLDRAQADMDRLMAQWETDYPEIHTGHFFTMEPLKQARVGSVRTPLLILMGAVGFVLLVVCANMANLLLVRGQTMERETAIRRALGAGRWRLVQGALVQSLLLAAGGALIGLGLAYVGVDALMSLAGGNLPRADEVGLDGQVLAFTAALTTLTALAFGAIPALQVAFGENLEALGEGGRSGTARGRTLRTRNGLVLAEVALSIVLIVGAGLMMRSFVRLMTDDPGFNADGVLLASVSLPRAPYPEPESVVGFYQQLLDRLRGLPGVVRATASTHLPVYSGPTMNDFVLDGLPEPGPGEPRRNGAAAFVSADYFETMGIPILRGRGIELSDADAAPPVAVISQSLADRFIPDRDPIGMRMRMDVSNDPPWLTIVGVVGDVQLQGLGRESGVYPAYYMSHAQVPTVLGGGGWGRFMTLVIRTDGDPRSAAPAVRAAVGELDPSLPLIDIQPYREALSDSVAQPRIVMALMSVFAVVALLLGAVGIYGVTSYAVAQRRHEIGIRMALGARSEEVAGLVIRKGMWPVLWGVALGVVAALAGSRVLDSLLFEVSRTDLPTYGVVVLILTAVAFVACWVPARRAMRVDPMTTLKSE